MEAPPDCWQSTVPCPKSLITHFVCALIQLWRFSRQTSLQTSKTISCPADSYFLPILQKTVFTVQWLKLLMTLVIVPFSVHKLFA